MSKRRGIHGISLLAVVSACSAETGLEDKSVEQSQDYVLNGQIVTPWPNGTPAYTRAIVDLGGCTGTLVDPEWVVSAKHCSFKVGATVTNRRPAGNVTRTVDRVEGHPTTREDGALLHLSQPINDVPDVPLYWGTTAGITNQTINCYGYGANSVGPACTNGTCTNGRTCRNGWCVTTCSDTKPCASGGCSGGICLTNTGDLRTAALMTTTHADQVTDPGTVETKASATKQITLPGDSGGPCFFNGQFAATNSAWFYNLTGGIQTSLADFRSWMLATERGQAGRMFQGIDSSVVYVRNRNNEIWKDTGSSANRVKIDWNARDFQGISGSVIYVVGFDGNLWREHPDLNSRDLVDSNVRKFQALDSTTVYVLDKNGDLWREVGNSSNRTWVDGNVLNFRAVNSTTVYVLGRDRNLWNETGTMANRSLVASSVVDFQGIDASVVYVLADDMKLWKVYGSMSNTILRPGQVDANVKGFQGVAGGLIYVLGQDNKLWRERGVYTDRDWVDSSVADFQAMDASMVYVMGQDGKLWREIGSMNNRSLVDSR
jgi:hypothetical protein